MQITQNLRQTFIFIHADKTVYLRHFIKKFLAVAFGKAAGYDQLFFAFSAFLVTAHFQDFIDGFFFRVIDKAAGIHHDDVCLLRRIGQREITFLAEEALGDLCIVKIFGTA